MANGSVVVPVATAAAAAAATTSLPSSVHASTHEESNGISVFGLRIEARRCKDSAAGPDGRCRTSLTVLVEVVNLAAFGPTMETFMFFGLATQMVAVYFSFAYFGIRASDVRLLRALQLFSLICNVWWTVVGASLAALGVATASGALESKEDHVSFVRVRIIVRLSIWAACAPPLFGYAYCESSKLYERARGEKWPSRPARWGRETSRGRAAARPRLRTANAHFVSVREFMYSAARLPSSSLPTSPKPVWGGSTPGRPPRVSARRALEAHLSLASEPVDPHRRATLGLEEFLELHVEGHARVGERVAAERDHRLAPSEASERSSGSPCARLGVDGVLLLLHERRRRGRRGGSPARPRPRARPPSTSLGIQRKYVTRVGTFVGLYRCTGTSARHTAPTVQLMLSSFLPFHPFPETVIPNETPTLAVVARPPSLGGDPRHGLSSEPGGRGAPPKS